MNKYSLNVLIIFTLLFSFDANVMAVSTPGAEPVAVKEEKAVELKPDELPDAYKSLGFGCMTQSNPSCCMSSAKMIAQGKYFLVNSQNPQQLCPVGFEKNMLKCESSYQWCEPVKKGNL